MAMLILAETTLQMALILEGPWAPNLRVIALPGEVPFLPVSKSYGIGNNCGGTLLKHGEKAKIGFVHSFERSPEARPVGNNWWGSLRNRSGGSWSRSVPRHSVLDCGQPPKSSGPVRRQWLLFIQIQCRVCTDTVHRCLACGKNTGNAAKVCLRQGFSQAWMQSAFSAKQSG